MYLEQKTCRRVPAIRKVWVTNFPGEGTRGERALHDEKGNANTRFRLQRLRGRGAEETPIMRAVMAGTPFQSWEGIEWKGGGMPAALIGGPSCGLSGEME